MPSPYLAPSLARLRTSVNTRWPGRDKRSDGWIGDEAHQSRTSDHNPDASGVVRALDLDRDGLHVPSVLAATFIHPSVRYVIHRRKIFHIDNDFKPKTYTGSNPHEGHIHISIEHSKAAEASKGLWAPVSSAWTFPQLHRGMDGVWAARLQAYLNGHGASLRVDGDFGEATEAALRAFQKAKKLDVDGWAGPQVSLALRTR